jgi:hypothetical protein
MFFREWKAVLRQVEPLAIERAASVASVDAAAIDGERRCPRPEQAQKCFKLDYILWAQGAAGPAQTTRHDLSERCRLCKEITDAEPLVHWEPQEQRISQETNKRWAQ